MTARRNGAGQWPGTVLPGGMVPAKAGTVSVQFLGQPASLEQDGQYAASQLAGGLVPPIGGTVGCRAIARREVGDVAGPCRALRGHLSALSMPGQSAGPVSARQPPGGAPSGGVPPDVMRGGRWTAGQRPGGTVPPTGGTVSGRRGVRPAPEGRTYRPGCALFLRPVMRVSQAEGRFLGLADRFPQNGLNTLGARDRQACLWMGLSLWMR